VAPGAPRERRRPASRRPRRSHYHPAERECALPLRVSSFSTAFGCRSAPRGFILSLSESGGIPCRRGCIPMRGRRDAMLEILVATVVGLVLVVGPWPGGWSETAASPRALATAPTCSRSSDRRLGGESFVSVQVTPRSCGRCGQVVVAVPGGWEWMLEDVWPVLLARVPRGYELVVRRGEEAPASARSAPSRRLTPACRPGSPSRTMPAGGNPACTSGWPRFSRTRARRRAIGTST
jgi:hypothetical protein